MAKNKLTPAETIDRWLERDLTAAAEAGELPRAFAVDSIVEQMSELVASDRHPVLIGEGGVGKTAALYEWVRRVQAGGGPAALEGKRVLQFSLRRRAAALNNPGELRPEFQKLLDALQQAGNDVVPFFCDLHVAHEFGLEPLLHAFAYRFEQPILGEGRRAAVESMLESNPELEQHYVVLKLDEPSLPAAERILTEWNAEEAAAGRRAFAAAALDEALYLSHRFLTRMRLPRKALDLLKQVASLAAGNRTIGAAQVIDRFCRSHKVPRFLVDPDLPLDLEEVDDHFRTRLLGQAEAVRAVVNMISLIKAGLSDVRRPFGVFLFVGPTGVGKTHVAQLLADYLFGSRDRTIRFNMADFQLEYSASTLFGDPDDHRLPNMRGQLTQRIQGHPFAVLLLDEFEKAHEVVRDRFLQLIDEGCFINGAGEMVSCRSTIIIATSNSGAEVYRQQALGFTGSATLEALDQEVDRRLNEQFRFEFLNRFDEVVHFHPLARADIRTIAWRELEQLQDRVGLKRRGLVLEADDDLLDWLTVHGYDPHFGARFLRRTIERHVTTVLSNFIVRTDPPVGAQIELTVREDQVVARLQPETSNPPMVEDDRPLALCRS
jgi:ATP-dependent Clp protease ATP-binding subunit ClpA